MAQIGGAAEIYERPRSRFVADFVGAVNLFDGTLVAGFNTLALSVRGIETAASAGGNHRSSRGGGSHARGAAGELRLSAVQPEGIGIAATVSSINNQGGVSIIHLTAASGHALKAQMASAAAAGFERGVPVWASWSPDDAVVITR